MGSPWERQDLGLMRRLYLPADRTYLHGYADGDMYVIRGGPAHGSVVGLADLPTILDPMPATDDLAWLRGEPTP